MNTVVSINNALMDLGFVEDNKSLMYAKLGQCFNFFSLAMENLDFSHKTMCYDRRNHRFLRHGMVHSANHTSTLFYRHSIHVTLIKIIAAVFKNALRKWLSIKLYYYSVQEFLNDKDKFSK